MDLYIWFYTKYNNGVHVNIDKLKNVSGSTITYYLKYDINHQSNWDVDVIKQIHETRTEIIIQKTNNNG